MPTSTDAPTQPEANAPDPVVLREDLINILLGKNPACGQNRAEQIVDAMLIRQMEYYAGFAEAEIDTDSVEAAVIIQTLMGNVMALISMGASVVDYMADKVKWQTKAAQVRAGFEQLSGMIG
jgi:hypothetical protein